MKNLFINSPLFIYSFFFVLILNFSDGKTHIAVPKSQDECRANLEALNNALLQDEDGILNEDEVESYESCVGEVRNQLDNSYGEAWEDNRNNELFMLECYVNLMDYYDLAGDDAKAEHYEEEIDQITGTE